MTETLSDLSQALSSLAARVSGGIVAVQGGRGASSGFLWREGLVVTAEEALEKDEDLGVGLPDGSRARASLVGRDPSTDVALLRVEGATPPPVALDADASPRVGDLALAVGRSGEGPLAAFGIIGTAGPAWRSLRGGMIDALLRLDLRLPRAAEGGLAVGATGQAIGMAVLGPRRSTLVIPAATVERVAARLLEHGRIGRGYLGLGLQPVQVDGGEGRGVIVVSVAEDGPGRRAGIVQGDVVTRFGGEPVAGLRALLARLGPESVGREVELEVRRGGEPRSVTLTIADRPAP